MDLLAIMVNIAKFLKNKLVLFLSKGHKLKVDKKSYLLFEKEEYFDILIYLERVFSDLFKSIIFLELDEDDEDFEEYFYDKHKEIRVFFRMTLIEKYL